MTLTVGSDIYTASKLLGHTNVHTTEIYADVIMDVKIGTIKDTDLTIIKKDK